MKRKKQVFILLKDDLPPEGNAMLQALYSRDPQSVTEHLKRVEEVGAEKFMASYYVGYGHKSIGDCGTTTIFIEQVSLLATKAIQDWPLYNGQEASTRYLDMSAQEALNPLGTKEGKEIQDEWMSIYNDVLTALEPYLKEHFPLKDGENEKTYIKAIKAKAFDIGRGFLPGGITTLCSWHTNLRQAYDHIQQLSHHPLPEIREIASKLHNQLKDKYTSSFSHKTYPDQEEYLSFVHKELTYFNDPKIKKFKAVSTLDSKHLKKYKNVLKLRPQKTELPYHFKRFGDIRFSFPMDFGSYRDLQRHRSAVIMMPLLTIDHGFFPWYLSQLPGTIIKSIQKRISLQEKRIKKLKAPPEIKQYYTAIGYTVTCEVTAGLPSAVYLAELRASQTVHPTLRAVAQQMAASLKEFVPWLTMHYDNSPDVWNIKRGSQDIVKK